MGKKRKKNRNRNQDFLEDDNTFKEFELSMRNQGLKQKSKVTKKMKKQLQKLEQRKRHLDKYDIKPEFEEKCGYQKVTASFKGDLTINKAFLLSSIKNYIDDPFHAYGNFISEDSLSFYIDTNKNIAGAIKSLNKKIQSSCGQVIGLDVDYVLELDFILNCEQTELLKNVVLQRYDQNSGLLNLSSLHLDTALMESNTFAPLSNERIFKQVLSFIKDTLPSLKALDLSNNKLSDRHLGLLKVLTSHSMSLSAINLENNLLKTLKLLESLRPFPLKELKLLNNLYKEGKGSPHSLIKMVKKILPFLKIMDGFDLTELSLKLNKPKFVNLNEASMRADVISSCNIAPVTEENIKTFLEQYYSLFDTVDKGALIQAYVPTAILELNSQNPLFPSKSFEGHNEIREFLDSWPESKHDHTTFQLEILNLSVNEGICKIEGCCGFMQNEASVNFRRVMKIVPYNTGFCCVADTLCIL